MRSNASLLRYLILTLIIALIISTSLAYQAKADGTPPEPPIGIVEPEIGNPDSTIVSDSLAGPDSFVEEDFGFLNWVMVLLTTTF